MNNFTYETQGANTYLVYKMSEEDVIDSMSLGMITNNKISGLAPTIFTQMDSNKFIKYNVSAKISVKQFFSGSVNKKRLIGVFKGIVNAMLSAEDYMIDSNSIILDFDYIFTDVSTCETILLCLPIIDGNQETVDLSVFFKNIMFTTQFDQTENCDHVAKIINYLNSTPVLSLSDFKELLDTLENGNAMAPVVTTKKVVVDNSQVQKTVSTPIQQQVKATSALNVQQPVTSQQKTTITPQQQMNVPPQQKTLVAQQQNFAVPSANQMEKDVDETAATEKEISFLYLMQHYNKDNAAAYKAQKEARKKAKAEGKLEKQDGKKNKKKSSEQQEKNEPVQNFGFAVPGQPAPVPKQEPSVPVQQKPVSQPSVFSGNQAKPAENKPPVQPAVTSQPAYVPRQMPQGTSMNFGETTILNAGGIGETTVLNAGMNPAQMVTPHLIRAKNNEKILLDKPVFRVGKERSYVDYFIGDNTAISRSHANFITREGTYFVVDTNSTNHTFVNSRMIPSNEENVISHGDHIRLANEEFEFRLY